VRCAFFDRKFHSRILLVFPSLLACHLIFDLTLTLTLTLTLILPILPMQVLDACTSSLVLAGTLTHPNGSTTACQIKYCKQHPSYVQRVTVDSVCFGYSSRGGGGGGAVGGQKNNF
jgi:hypothetical protein